MLWMIRQRDVEDQELSKSSVEENTYIVAVERATLKVLLQSLSWPLNVLILSFPKIPTLHLPTQNVLSSEECLTQWPIETPNSLHALPQFSTADLT